MASQIPLVPSDDFSQLIATRQAFYASMSGGWVNLAEATVNPLVAAYSREAVYLTVSAAGACAVMLPTLDPLGGWALLPAVMTGLAGIFTGLWAKDVVATPAPPPTLRADVALAHDDFRTAVQALAEARVDVVMAVRAFESTVATAMDAILDPQTGAEARDAAVDALTAIAARAWAMTQVEERRAEALEHALSEGSSSVLDLLHSSVLDFSEIETAAARATQETRMLQGSRDTSQEPRT